MTPSLHRLSTSYKHLHHHPPGPAQGSATSELSWTTLSIGTSHGAPAKPGPHLLAQAFFFCHRVRPALCPVTQLRDLVGVYILPYIPNLISHQVPLSHGISLLFPSPSDLASRLISSHLDFSRQQTHGSLQPHTQAPIKRLTHW